MNHEFAVLFFQRQLSALDPEPFESILIESAHIIQDPVQTLRMVGERVAVARNEIHHP